MQSKQHQIINNPNHIQLTDADLFRGDCLAVIPTLTGQFDAIVIKRYLSENQSRFTI